jgi:hypothetical protein
MKLTTHMHLMLRLRLHGAVLLFCYMSVRCMQVLIFQVKLTEI